MLTCDNSKWVSTIRITVEEGKLKHSGQTRALKVYPVPGGVRIGCTFISYEAIDYIRERTT